MNRPTYSVVVPTRERAATLRACLATCVAHDRDDVEIVVADNASGPETRDVCESFGCRRIRWLRCPEPLSMNDNWERALAAARGEWIMFLGDDDGLMPHAFRELDRLVAAHDVEAVHWQYAVYTWPCMTIPGEANRLQILHARDTRMVRWDRAIAAMLAHGATPVPMIYHGLIRRTLVEKAWRTGRVFEGLSPDYFSGVLFAALAGRFLDTQVPMSLAGLSGRSNGVANMRTEDSRRSAVAREFAELNRRAGVGDHPELPPYYVNHGPLAALDPLFRARDRLFPRHRRFRLPSTTIAAWYLAALSPDPETRREQCDLLRRYLAVRAPRVDFAALRARHEATAPPPQVILDRGRLGRHGPWEVIDTAAHGVSDVHAAAELASRLLGHDTGPIEYTIPAARPGLLGRMRRSLAKRMPRRPQAAPLWASAAPACDLPSRP